MKEQSFLRPLWGHRRVIAWGAMVAVALAIVIGGATFFFQESRWTATLEFRPLFAGAESGRYPNDLPFSTTDITDRSIVDTVFDLNHVEPMCSREQFRSSFAVTKSVSRLRQLDDDYQSRLANGKITAVERQLLQEEYQGKREGLSARYQLTFLRSADCSRLSTAVVYKALNDLLQTWAADAEKKRGVMKPQARLLSPNIFDFGNAKDESLLVRADLIRMALRRALANARDVKIVPGVVALRAGPNQANIQEVIVQLEDLIRSLVDPLVKVAGRGMGQQAERWVEEALKASVLAEKAAQARYLAYLAALREYSGGPPPTSIEGSLPADRKSQGPLDASVIDRVVALSPINTSYRQALTGMMIAAENQMVVAQGSVERYTQLKDLLASGVTSDLTLDQAAKQLDEVEEAGRTLVEQMNAIVDEYSRTSLRPAGGLYQVEQSAGGQTLRTFGLRAYLIVVAFAGGGAAVLLAAVCLAFDHLRALLRTQVAPAE